MYDELHKHSMDFIWAFEVNPSYDIFLEHCKPCTKNLPLELNEDEDSMQAMWLALLETIASDIFSLYGDKDTKQRSRCISLITRVLQFAVSYLLEVIEKRAKNGEAAVIPNVHMFHSVSPWGMLLYVTVPPRDNAAFKIPAPKRYKAMAVYPSQYPE